MCILKVVEALFFSAGVNIRVWWNFHTTLSQWWKQLHMGFFFFLKILFAFRRVQTPQFCATPLLYEKQAPETSMKAVMCNSSEVFLPTSVHVTAACQIFRREKKRRFLHDSGWPQTAAQDLPCFFPTFSLHFNNFGFVRTHLIRTAQQTVKHAWWSSREHPDAEVCRNSAGDCESCSSTRHERAEECSSLFLVQFHVAVRERLAFPPYILMLQLFSPLSRAWCFSL